MEENKELEELTAMFGEMEEELAEYPQPNAQSGQKYWPWVAVGGLICGPKGVAILPKGTTYPKPVSKAPMTAPQANPAPVASPQIPPQKTLSNDFMADFEMMKKRMAELEERVKMKEDELKKKEEETKKKEEEMMAQMEDLKKCKEEKEKEIEKLKSGKKLSMDTGTAEFTKGGKRESFEDTIIRVFGGNTGVI